MLRQPRSPSGVLATLFGIIGMTGMAACSGSEPEGAASELVEAASPDLRAFIARQVGGLDKLKVPSDDASLPLPPEDPRRPGRYRTTEAKRYLGKMLFHDPVRTARVNVNIRLLSGQGRP